MTDNDDRMSVMFYDVDSLPPSGERERAAAATPTAAAHASRRPLFQLLLPPPLLATSCSPRPREIFSQQPGTARPSHGINIVASPPARPRLGRPHRAAHDDRILEIQ